MYRSSALWCDGADMYRRSALWYDEADMYRNSALWCDGADMYKRSRVHLYKEAQCKVKTKHEASD